MGPVGIVEHASRRVDRRHRAHRHDVDGGAAEAGVRPRSRARGLDGLPQCGRREIYASYRDLGQGDLVDHLFSTILGRGAAAGERAAWQAELARMQAIGIDGREALYAIATALFGGAEYAARGRTNTQFLADVYAAYYNRAVDAGGASFWGGELGAGAPRDMVRQGIGYTIENGLFVGSRWGDTASRPEDYLASDLYRVILNRLGESANVAYWRGRLRTAQCTSAAAVRAEADAAAAAFFGSAEYVYRGRSNLDFVQDLYLVTMRRYASLYELWSWTNALNNGDVTRTQARQMFTASVEFGYRVNAIMQAGCLR